MTDYIKRFQSRLNKFDSIDKKDRSREGIIIHLEILGFIDPAIAEKDGNKKNLVVLNDINERDAYALLLTELQGDSADLAVQDDIAQTERLMIMEDGLEPSETPTLSLVLNQEQKQELVQVQAQNLGLTLINTEVRAIAVNMASEFASMTEVLRTISEHLQRYTAQIAAENEQIILDGLNQSRNILNQSATRVQSELSNFAQEAQQRSLDFKSLSSDLQNIFAII